MLGLGFGVGVGVLFQFNHEISRVCSFQLQTKSGKRKSAVKTTRFRSWIFGESVRVGPAWVTNIHSKKFHLLLRLYILFSIFIKKSETGISNK